MRCLSSCNQLTWCISRTACIRVQVDRLESVLCPVPWDCDRPPSGVSRAGYLFRSLRLSTVAVQVTRLQPPDWNFHRTKTKAQVKFSVCTAWRHVGGGGRTRSRRRAPLILNLVTRRRWSQLHAKEPAVHWGRRSVGRRTSVGRWSRCGYEAQSQLYNKSDKLNQNCDPSHVTFFNRDFTCHQKLANHALGSGNVLGFGNWEYKMTPSRLCAVMDAEGASSSCPIHCACSEPSAEIHQHVSASCKWCLVS